MSAEHSSCEVVITVAVSEGGATRCCIAESPMVQQRHEHRRFMDELRRSPAFWHVKTVKVSVPIPVSFEDMTGGANAR